MIDFGPRTTLLDYSEPNLRRTTVQLASKATGEVAILIASGDLSRSSQVPIVRINSACFTSEVLRDESCDCAWQLHESIRLIRLGPGPGIVLYLPDQEGRGYGLAKKLEIMSMSQELGSGFTELLARHEEPLDLRTYDWAFEVLDRLGLVTISLLTNNPQKVEALIANGMNVSRVPLVKPKENWTQQNESRFKRALLGHEI